MKEGLNIVDDLPDGYKIGIIRKAGAQDEWVTVAPDGKTTQKVTSEGVSKKNSQSLTVDRMEWECRYVGGDRGWVCRCVRNCVF